MIDKVKSILLNELNLDMIDDNARQEDYSEWDSLTYLRVLAVLEDEFGLQITSENINKFNSISNIVREIENA
ncbi:MAG: acyl carrier protein [Candidatus Brocadiaceae bacterium]|nr:acyl carrier protein [Candidatus Brocadiaceae bacterium]